MPKNAVKKPYLLDRDALHNKQDAKVQLDRSAIVHHVRFVIRGGPLRVKGASSDEPPGCEATAALFKRNGSRIDY